MKIISVLFLILCSVIANAQVKRIPAGGNKKAAVFEQIGVTDVTINYDRPAVKGREGKIWGELVHYGFADLHYGTSTAAPWRAGANENTTIEFSTDVTIAGKPLAAGKYGFFIAMGKDKASIIFSKDNNSWGSFYYDATHDALRADVALQYVDESRERLQYEFSDQTDNSAVVSLCWEKIKIPFKIGVGLKSTQLAEYRHAFNNGNFYRYWQNMQEAANFCLVNDTNIEEGLKWANSSINTFFGESNFNTLTTYAGLLEKNSRSKEADSIMKKALPMGTLYQLATYGDNLLKQKKYKAAFEVFKLNFEKSPKEILSNFGMIKANAAMGNKSEAIKFADKTILLAADKATKDYLLKFKQDMIEGKDILNQ
jgi:Protein of unknown function (DUF2911)